MTYNKHYNARKTEQNQPIPGKEMVANSAGGYAFAVSDWDRLQRFLILGAEGGTYYIGEKTLTIENAEAVLRCIKTDGLRVVQEVVRVSEAGRAPKNDPALFVLAMCAGLGDGLTKKAALVNLPHVARIGTHLFNFAEYIQAFRGWGRALRRAVANWYTEKDPKRLAYQLVKYQQRNGWSHRDLLRLSHPKSDEHNVLFNWVTQGPCEGRHFGLPARESTQLIYAFERAKTATEEETITLIQEAGLTREMIQTKYLNSPAVWEALLENMPMTAMIRNLGKMTQVGLLGDGKWDANELVIDRLHDSVVLAKARVHPLNVLLALRTYDSGGGYRGKLTWTPSRDIVSALDDAFYLSFDEVPPTGKRFVMGIDVSNSMSANVAGTPLSAAEAAAAMAMVTRRVEDKAVIRGFSGSRGWSRFSSDPESKGDDFKDLGIEQKERLESVMSKTSAMNYGRTDCALPMIWALENKVKADVFAIYTDSETWVGDIHPIQALQEYREKMGIPAKLIVVAMTSNGFSIADPNDRGMLDVVGFDTSIPAVMDNFIND